MNNTNEIINKIKEMNIVHIKPLKNYLKLTF